MDFFKYEASGNDFILVDLLGSGDMLDIEVWLEFFQKTAPKLCDRHYGVGADGILVLAPSKVGYAFMHIINADGSTAAMCGNGIRCAARYLYKKRIFDIRGFLQIETLGGLQTVCFVDKDEESWIIDVKMAHAIIDDVCTLEHQGEKYEGIVVDTGNPHIVFEVLSPTESLDTLGPIFSNDPQFPDRINVEFIAELQENIIDFTVYERGVGPTLSCGTGCVAAAVAYAAKRELAKAAIEIHAPGGILHVILKNDEIHLQGPVKFVFSGHLEE